MNSLKKHLYFNSVKVEDEIEVDAFEVKEERTTIKNAILYSAGNGINVETVNSFNVDNNTFNNITDCAMAYFKCRNCDPLSSFGDFVCCSDTVDTIVAIAMM